MTTHFCVGDSIATPVHQSPGDRYLPRVTAPKTLASSAHVHSHRIDPHRSGPKPCRSSSTALGSAFHSDWPRLAAMLIKPRCLAHS